MAAILGKGLQKLLFGELRLIEIEHIYERSRVAVLNSLIGLTMFSNEYLLIPGILTLFSLFMKVFHWILKDRFDYIFQNATTPSQILRTRNTLTLLILLYVDFHLVYTCVEYSFGNNPDVYFAFGFEFAVMFLDLLLQGSKVLLNTCEVIYLGNHPDEDAMESKSLYMKILEITHSSLVLVIHLFLLFTLVGPSRYPIYLFKDIFFNTLHLIKQIKELRRYQKASKELDSRLQDATEEDLADDNNLCIICRDDMTTIDVIKGNRAYPKKLQCGHIIHLGCLKGWFERSQACPMCRAPVFMETSAAQQTDTSQQTHEQQNQQPQQQNQVQDQFEQIQNQIRGHIQTAHRDETIQPPPFLNQHLPHPSGFFQSPRTSTGIQRSELSNINDNTLRLRTNPMTPSGWTLLKLSNASPNNDEYQVRLNDGVTARIKRFSQKMKPFKINKKLAKQNEDTMNQSENLIQQNENRIKELEERVKNNQALLKQNEDELKNQIEKCEKLKEKFRNSEHASSEAYLD